MNDFDDNATGTIEISQAFRRLKASYLSERHSEQLLFALLEDGLLAARGIPEFFPGAESTRDAIIEDIDKDFWLGIDANWDSPHLGFSTGRFSSSGRNFEPDSDDDDDENCYWVHGSAINEKQQANRYYRNVQVSWNEILAMLETYKISNDDLQLSSIEDRNTLSGRKQVGRKMSDQWPVWIGVACKLAYEHTIHRTMTANSIVAKVFEFAPPDLSITKATVWNAAMAIAEAVGSSSIKHRFGELNAKPEPASSEDGTS